MKKILLVLCTALLLCACTDAHATIKNVKPYFKVGTETVTSRDIYEALLEQYGIEALSLFINEFIYDQLVTPDYDPMKKVNEEIAELREEYGDEYYSELYGYESESEIIDLFLEEEKTNLIFTSYIKDNFEAVIENYLPTKMAVAQFQDYQMSLMALAGVKDGESLADLAEELGVTEIFDGEPAIYSRESDLPIEVESYGLYATGPSLVDNPIAASDEQYYIVQVISVDRNSFKDEIIEELAYEEAINSEAISYYCKEYNLTYYDIAMIDLVKSSNPEYYP